MKTMNVYMLNLPEQVSLPNARSNREQSSSSDAQQIIQIDAKNIGDCNIGIAQSFHQTRYGFPIPQSEIEIFLTHIDCWRRFIASDLPFCLVIEENIRLDFSIPKIAKSVIELPNDWDIFFPYDPIETKKKSSSSSLKDTNIWERNEVEPYLLGFNWGSSIYFLSRTGAQKLLKIKNIRQCVEDEMLTLADDSLINLYYANIEGFNINRYPKKTNPDREELIHKAVLNYNVWSKSADEILKKILRVISNIAYELNIDIILHGGSLLGYVRHASKMNWDDDIDLGLREEDVVLFIEKIKETNLVVSEWTERSTDTTYYKVWSNEGQEISGHRHRFPFVDIWVFNVDKTDIVFKNGIVFPNAVVEPLRNVDFEGGVFAIPQNYMECLDRMYKDWRHMIRIYQWNHQNELPINYTLKTSISVDDFGRIREDNSMRKGTNG